MQALHQFYISHVVCKRNNMEIQISTAKTNEILPL